MALASASSTREPLGEINTTPLIDVLLVLLVVLVMAVPLASNSLEVELTSENRLHADRLRNLLTVETDGGLTWNGTAVDERELRRVLAEVRSMTPEPEVQFRPAANASYERSAHVVLIVKQSRVTNFGFLGNERYKSFGRP